MTPTDEVTRRLLAEIQRGPLFPEYPPVRKMDSAIEITLERIEEWEHGNDPHGWCHERPVLITLLVSLLGVNDLFSTLAESQIMKIDEVAPFTVEDFERVQQYFDADG